MLRHNVVRAFVSFCVLVFIRAILSWCILNLTYLHCLQHALLENPFNLHSKHVRGTTPALIGTCLFQTTKDNL